MTTLTVKTATASDEISIIDTIVLAMSSDPVMRWLSNLRDALIFPQKNGHLILAC